MSRALPYSAMPRSSASQTGRVTPRVTVSCTSLPVGRSDSMRSTAASRSSCRLAMERLSASQWVATQFTHCPPWMTPME